MGLAVWCEDEAGPYQTVPYAGASWELEGHPQHQPAEYIRNGTAKLLTLFHPADGQVRVKGVTDSTNATLHPWLKEELSETLASLPKSSVILSQAKIRAIWESWQEGLSVRFTLPQQLAPLRLLLVVDNLRGHYSSELVRWLFSQGILPLYTPVGGSWLNMAESIQRILKRRALDGQHPKTPQEIISWLEATARGWNHHRTPFIWGGKRAIRRRAQRDKRCHYLGGSGAYTRYYIQKNVKTKKWLLLCQMTH
jgi:hypothetical protein